MEQLNNTMTYYETLKKVVDYLNETSGQVSDLTDAMSYLQDEGLDLSVLDNFNTKLNDGTISNLINNTLLSNKANQSDIGILANLTTTDKTNLVNAINNNVTKLSEIAPLKPSGDTTGLTDTTSIQNLINTKGKAVLDIGNFYITSLTLNGTQEIIGAGTNQTIINTVATSGYAINITQTAQKCELRYFNLVSTYTGCGGISFNDIVVSPTYDTRHFMENIRISNMTGTSLYIGQYTRENRFLNVHANGSHDHCFWINGTDSFYNNMTANSSYKCGFYLGTTSANNNFSNCKAFLCGNSPDGTLLPQFRSGFYISGNGGLNMLNGMQSQQNYGDGFYIDSPSNVLTGFLSDGNGYMGNYQRNGLTVMSSSNTIIGSVQNPPLNGSIINFLYLGANAIKNTITLTATENTAQQLTYYGTSGYTTNSSQWYGEESSNPSNKVTINGDSYSNTNTYANLFGSPYLATGTPFGFGAGDGATFNSGTNELKLTVSANTTSSAREQYYIKQTDIDLSQFKYLYVEVEAKCNDVNRFFYPSINCFANIYVNGSGTYTGFTLNPTSHVGLKSTISTNYQKIIAVFPLKNITGNSSDTYTFNALCPSLQSTKRTSVTDGQSHDVYFRNANFYLSK